MTESAAIHPLLFEIEELHPARSAGIIRLPELVGVPLTARVRRLIDHPHFQRLRNVRQLSLTYLVYPGAVHTRFEHSLGVLETGIRYLTALLTNRRALAFLKPIHRGDLESLLLAMLLHDIGHYPFAHLLEDLYAEVPDHIDLVRPFLTGEIGRRYPSLALPDKTPALGDLVARDWPHASIDDIAYFVSGARAESEVSSSISNGKALLRSVLDGPVDADKMDYLYRDSIHCGVPYGRFIDRDRFFQALTVAADRPDRIALHEKGRICVELFAYARSAMFSEVYWHHSSRAVTAMVNRAFREAVDGDASLDRNTLMDRLFGRSDEEVVQWLSGRSGGACGSLMADIRNRRPYKRLLVIQKPSNPALFDMLDRCKWDSAHDFGRLQAEFIRGLNEKKWLADALGREILPHEILIDVPHRRSGLADVPIIREHEDHYVEDESGQDVWNGIRNDFERWVRKIRVFCHPEIREAIRRKSGRRRPDATLANRLTNLLSGCAWRESQRTD